MYAVVSQPCINNRLSSTTVIAAILKIGQKLGNFITFLLRVLRDEDEDRTHSRSAHTMIDLRLINEDIEIVGSSARYSEPKDLRDNIRSS